MKNNPGGWVQPGWVDNDWVDQGLFAFLQANNTFTMCDLYTITLANEQTLRWADFDIDITHPTNGYVYSSDGPVLKRGSTREVLGLEVDTLDLSIFPRPTDLVGGMSLLPAAHGGAFDGARLVLERAFLSIEGIVKGTIIRFSGRFADVTLSRTEMQVRVNSDLEALSTQLPRNVYQAGCTRTLYDAGCGVNRESYGVAGTVAAGTTASTVKCGLVNASGYFSRGYIRFISGALVDVSRTVKSYSPGSLKLFVPLPAVPALGDLFIAYPGCDKAQATCSVKFNNLANFRGCPYIPVPETAV